MAHRFLALFIIAPIAITTFTVACSSSDSDSKSPDSSCAAQTTFLFCQACCNPPKSFQDGNDAIDACICTDACKTECATNACAAAPTDPSAECTACHDSDATIAKCAPKGQAICNADPLCVTFQQCTSAAKCDDKPDF